MEPLDIIEGNKIIAEWLGFTYFPHNMEGVTEPGWKTTIDTSSISKFNTTADIFKPKESPNKRIYLARNHNGLLYHTLYDWLMPVYKQLMEIAITSKVDNTLYSEYVIMSESLRRGLDIIEVWKHAVECIRLLTDKNIKPLEKYDWEKSYYLESKDSHWILVNHDRKITLSYLPNKKYSRYNVTTIVGYNEFEELVNFIRKIS